MSKGGPTRIPMETLMSRIRSGEFRTEEEGRIIREYLMTPEGQKIFKNSTPVFGPNNTIIGRQVEDIFFKNFNASDRAKINYGDEELLNNKHNLKDYLNARGMNPSYFFRKGGMTIEEIRKGLPLRQEGGLFGLNLMSSDREEPFIDTTEKEQARLQYNLGSLPLKDRTFGYKAQQDYTNSVDNLFSKNPNVRFNNRAELVQENDYSYFPEIANTAFRGFANVFGPNAYGYESNPFDSQWGQQSYGDTNVAQLGGLIFGPSMKKGGKKWRGQYGGYNFLGQMTKTY
jgi:hypothetical protein